MPRPEWTHAAHLTVAVWHLKHFADDRAIDAMRNGIRAYNDAWGVLATPTGGYHETLTLFYLKAIARYIATLEANLPLYALTNSVVRTFADRELPLRYYTKTRLMSPEARTSWIEPDLMSWDDQ